MAMKKPLRFKGIGGRKSKKLKEELNKPIPIQLMKWSKNPKK